ncbi:hypothetical protein H3U50_05655 [Lactobacillus sp. M0398]|uniref:hypothetical protein n=1 Tax=unclassified Lactobacillus TaxID=2620435 RepID=UPI0018DB5108|nr:MULTISPECIES: hypothetical protein [unclassified Lactobacillus]MBI0121306.1 hypothetical protein [Lactobacillus sp. M0398]MBI0123453.1 hypothetical protein [Lactobacillus sp. W8174]MBI0135482.1 hypothetical protein [Lactobacillus sp. W8173]
MTKYSITLKTEIVYKYLARQNPLTGLSKGYGIEKCCNNLPRKNLAYHTSEELYERR